jgi:hypothetical protein
MKEIGKRDRETSKIDEEIIKEGQGNETGRVGKDNREVR